MRKRKKIDSSKIILPSIIVFFTIILFLSLPVLFNYNNLQNKIEKKFYSEFKINLKILGDISFKIFPRPHYLVNKANLDLNIEDDKSSIIEIKNLKIFIPTNKIYSKTEINIEGFEIHNTNIYFNIKDTLDFRNHLYYKINKPIYIKKSKFFLLDKNKKTILISPIRKIKYLINNKNNSKELKIKGNIFDVDYYSFWKRDYDNPNKTLNEIRLKNPNLFIKNFFSFKGKLFFKGKSSINFLNEDIIINYLMKDSKIYIDSPNQNSGQKIKLFGPLGDAVFLPEENKNLLCIAGGSGVAGMMSIIDRGFQEAYFTDRTCSLFFGVRFILYPPTLVKTRLQLQDNTEIMSNSNNKQRLYRGTYDAFRVIVREESMSALWKGFVPKSLGIVAGSAYISSYEMLRSKFMNNLGWMSVSLADSFELTEPNPIVDTIVVYLDGVAVTVGWQYDAMNNVIIFDMDHIPPDQTQVDIEYAIYGDCFD